MAEEDIGNAALSGAALLPGGSGAKTGIKITSGVVDGAKDTRKVVNGADAARDAIKLDNIKPNALPEGWAKTEHNGFTNIRDADGKIRIEIHPSDKVINYPHKPLYDVDGNPLDANGNIVDYRSSDAHIPLK